MKKEKKNGKRKEERIEKDVTYHCGIGGAVVSPTSLDAGDRSNFFTSQTWGFCRITHPIHKNRKKYINPNEHSQTINKIKIIILYFVGVE